ncbi:hypothetical protein DXT99_24600 [Pontibacter diazotrophicus]|uniref:Uncharacterized protein n=1 Tax=Pontibacter diazotrophicus TaxID=1400979 RepID=A0A3D8L271_9BACT|nr:hypothetical protein [Pontibacter diazotrophicus]RDV11443.1 hypothetical protein DXT99_24600 [Pontibacter diazotrophicus]
MILKAKPLLPERLHARHQPPHTHLEQAGDDPQREPLEQQELQQFSPAEELLRLPLYKLPMPVEAHLINPSPNTA